MNLLNAFPVTLATFSPMDMGIIFLVLLIFFGAKKLPEFARSMGQAVREFSKAKDDFEREITRPPETSRPHQLEHSSDPYHSTVETESTPVSTTVETHPVKPEGTQPYEASASVAGPVVEEEKKA
jgi:sec-independent protein translocase protein TatA